MRSTYGSVLNGTFYLSVYLEHPNVMVEWLTLLLRIRKVPGSNLGQETSSDEVFVVVLSHSMEILSSTKISPQPLFSHSFQSITHPSSFHSTLYSLSY
jgi:hypothetical protein